MAIRRRRDEDEALGRDLTAPLPRQDTPKQQGIEQYRSGANLPKDEQTGSQGQQTPTEATPWYVSPYQTQIDELTQAILNRPEFSYSYEDDPAWQAYRRQYQREGRRAQEDAMGQYAAMTGGMPSTAAVTAAQQARGNWDAKLMDRIPELEQLAYSMYMDQDNRDRQNLAALLGLDATAYGRANDERSWLYQQARDAIGDERYASETEWQHMLDLIAQEQALREFEYRQQRDAVGDSQWQQTFDWSQQMDLAQLERALQQTQYQQQQADRQYSYQQERDAQEDALALARILAGSGSSSDYAAALEALYGSQGSGAYGGTYGIPSLDQPAAGSTGDIDMASITPAEWINLARALGVESTDDLFDAVLKTVDPATGKVTPPAGYTEDEWLGMLSRIMSMMQSP